MFGGEDLFCLCRGHHCRGRRRRGDRRLDRDLPFIHLIRTLMVRLNLLLHLIGTVPVCPVAQVTRLKLLPVVALIATGRAVAARRGAT